MMQPGPSPNGLSSNAVSHESNTASRSELEMSTAAEGVETSHPNPNVQGHPYVYLAVYAGIPVYEMMVRGIGVMRREVDSYLNATQILKVAGVEKEKRTRILQGEIESGVHEKVQGGHGRYQGTWIPFERGVELARKISVMELIAPLLDYTAPPPPTSLGQPITSISNGHGYGHDAMDTSSDGVNGSGKKRSARELGMEEGAKRFKGDGGDGKDGVYGIDVKFKLKRSTKFPADSPSLDHLTLERHKTILKSIFSIDSSALLPGVVPDLSTSFPAGIDSDTAIDDHDHTSLHWAAALARISIVRGLVNFGADMHRGNNVGETPLIRAVLVTNNSDNDSLPRLLEVLGPSLRTVDDTGRTILHHAALVAGVKGRASSARYYMESVLEYVARHEKGQYKELVDAQDIHGDTALNIAARVGNKGLVRMLIEVGADKLKPNKLGLRPGDFGVEGVDLAVSSTDDIIAGITGLPIISVPAQKSNEVISEISSIITSLSTSFAEELKTPTEALLRTQGTLRIATQELSEQRRQITFWRAKAAAAEEKSQRIKNLERAFEEEDSFDWTGRSEIDGQPTEEATVGTGFAYRGPGSTLSNLPAGIAIEFDVSPPIPIAPGTKRIAVRGEDGEEVEQIVVEKGPGGEDLVIDIATLSKDLIHLTRLEMWYDRVTTLLRQRIEKLQGGNIEQEARLRKVVANCCGVEVDKVEGMLESLLAALESDGGSALDLTRVSGFLSRVRDGSI